MRFSEYTNSDFCSRVAADILKYETKIAALHFTRTESRDPILTYSKMPVSKLVELSTSQLTRGHYLARGLEAFSLFDWNKYFSIVGKPVESFGDVSVSNIKYLSQFATLLSSPNLIHYIRFHITNSFTSDLPSTYFNLNF